MKKLASLVLVALIGVLASVGFASSASAYPDAQQNLTVDRQVLYGGESFTAFATSNVTCDWTLEWNGDSRDQTSEDFTTEYEAPVVTEITKIPLNGTCLYDTLEEPRIAAKAAATGTFEKTIIITVLPRGSAVNPPTDGDLPNTGGPNLWILIAGLASVAAGAVVIRTSQRRGSKA
jgi:LPXTG-motif cell wall-anchored protein